MSEVSHVDRVTAPPGFCFMRTPLQGRAAFGGTPRGLLCGLSGGLVGTDGVAMLWGSGCPAMTEASSRSHLGLAVLMGS